MTNPAVIKGARVIRNLMKQMGLAEEKIPSVAEHSQQPPVSNSSLPDTDVLDIDAIIQSFRHDQADNNLVATMNVPVDTNEGQNGNFLWFDGVQDMLFGFMSNDHVQTG